MIFTLLLGFLFGIIFSSIVIIYLFFQVLSKKVDPKQQQYIQQQKLAKKSNTASNRKGGILNGVTSLVFAPSSSQQQQQQQKQQTTYDLIDLSDQPPTSIETCKWINFITARLLSDINNSNQFIHKVYNILNNIFDEQTKPDFLGKVHFSDINFGTTTPEVGTVKLVSPPNAPVSILEFDIIYSGDASVTASSELWLNWPQRHMACLPVKTKLSIKQFSGKFVLYIPNTPNPVCSLYLKDSPQISIRMISKMGYETVLKEPGKLGSFLQTHIIKFINQKLVAPNKISFNLFSFLYSPMIVNHNSISNSSSNHHNSHHHHHHSNNNSSNTASPLSLTPMSVSTGVSPITSPILSSTATNGNVASFLSSSSPLSSSTPSLSSKKSSSSSPLLSSKPTSLRTSKRNTNAVVVLPTTTV
ncbi:hypothetical protein CYY_006656 [Polysphondylium violaceum]|uniref:SMP-LTD domain-containing protein n=1 Tax=Polysphondylium violaceum TaxID=133409 RepID=A0A8J4PRK3_9MYCE|nr:hypothetical protein CYY_006656 [Polysphondylium violaceum]